MLVEYDAKTYDAAPRSLLVLTSLAGGVKHGYAIAADVERFSGVCIRAGTLYGLLERLERDGLIEALPVEGRRNPCGLTRLGWDVLAAQVQALDRVVRAGSARISVQASSPAPAPLGCCDEPSITGS